MRQLVELGKNKDKFAQMNTEVIAIFREEKKGEEGLKMIKEKTETPFTLALDNGKEKTGRYSGGKGEFTGYVISSKGKVVKIVKGDLRNRAKSEQLLAAIKSSSSGSDAKEGSGKKSGTASKGASEK